MKHYTYSFLQDFLQPPWNP